jgi:hypothetical protein
LKWHWDPYDAQNVRGDGLTYLQVYQKGHLYGVALDTLIPTNQDFDGDGMPDLYEAINDLNMFNPHDALGLNNTDYLFNIQRYRLNIPLTRTVDPSSYQQLTGIDPASLTIDPELSVAEQDWDGDGISNRDELMLFKTDPAHESSHPNEVDLLAAIMSTQVSATTLMANQHLITATTNTTGSTTTNTGGPDGNGGSTTNTGGTDGNGGSTTIDGGQGPENEPQAPFMIVTDDVYDEEPDGDPTRTEQLYDFTQSVTIPLVSIETPFGRWQWEWKPEFKVKVMVTDSQPMKWKITRRTYQITTTLVVFSPTSTTLAKKETRQLVDTEIVEEGTYHKTVTSWVDVDVKDLSKYNLK